MSKRMFIAAVITVLFSFSFLTGCGKTAAPPAQEEQGTREEQQPAGQGELQPEAGAELLVWESKGPELDYLKAVSAEFEKEYGVKVKVEAVPAIDSVKKLTTDGPAGIGADVFSAPHDQIGNAVAAGLVLENDAFDEKAASEFMSSAIDGVTYQGVLYGFPTAIDTYALFYNKKLMGQAPKTYEDIVKFAETYNDPENKKFALLWDVSQLYQSYSFLAGYGGYVFGNNGEDANDIGLNSGGAIEGAKFLQSLKKILPININDLNDNIITGFFQEGKAAAIINGPWLISNLSTAEMDYGVVPLPLLPNGERPVSFSGIRALYVNSYTKYPAAAKLFASYATNKENLTMRFEMTAQLPPRNDLTLDPIITNNPDALAFLEQAKHSTPMPSIPEMGNVWQPASAAFASIWNDDQDPAAALNKAVEQIKTAITKR
ncbi:sugar ABC transporter substrate-binding protein [Paenibacillus sp. DMB20]|uniref:sugar ABC transporter substrate-binding protein n=1 Tax=Paenibacillus sp. DMB20 TaxID=1642570 RepID=UPI000627739E|nr:maltose ABC transporter substrate-binding protein [Paenibacillus sp. DMB20]KKO54868.1 ABC transporter substrate-binding protein [Paenibacillus sp. DMB20]